VWKTTSKVSEDLAIPIHMYLIGLREDYEVVYSECAELRVGEESGCVLVRPDRFIGWRCNEVLQDSTKCTMRYYEIDVGDLILAILV